MYLLWQYLTFVVFNHYHIIISSPLGWPAPKPSSLLPSNITPILAGPALTINPPLQQLFDHFRWHSSAKPPSLFIKTWELHIFWLIQSFCCASSVAVHSTTALPSRSILLCSSTTNSNTSSSCLMGRVAAVIHCTASFNCVALHSHCLAAHDASLLLCSATFSLKEIYFHNWRCSRSYLHSPLIVSYFTAL